MAHIFHKNKFITLRKKFLSGYGIVLFLMIMVIAWAIFNLERLGLASNAILDENYKSILAAENMINTIERQDSAILLIVAGYQQEGSAQFEKYGVEFAKWLGRAADNITIKGEKEIIDGIESQYKAYLSKAALILKVEKVSTATGELYHDEVLPLFESVRASCIRLRIINQETMYRAGNHARSVARWAVLSMAVIGLGAIIVGFGLSLFLSKLITSPLRQFMHATEELSKGNYNIKVAAETKDELGRLAQHFNNMSLKLKKFHDMNIEEILNAKRRNEAIIRSIDDGMIVVDSDLRIISINPVALQIFGLASEPDVEGKHFWETIKNERLARLLRETFESGIVSDEKGTENVLDLNGGEKTNHYQFSITPVLSSRQMLGVVLLLRDITKLKELDRLKSEFVMSASHELRTPLTSIEMSVGLLQENAILSRNENAMKLLSIMLEEITRLKSLINDLLDLSKIEAGRMPMDFSAITIETVFEKTEIVMKNQALENGIELSFNIAENLPLVRADANKITWILTNLISNAMRFTKPDGHIEVTANQAGQHLHVCVKDDGIGIPYEFQSKIFDKFVQVKNAKDTGGTGLGLAICKEIIRAHGGSIWVESAPGKGSLFTFTLPTAE
jgi:two-component system, NtrC family, sensor histidine kinase KinB